MKIMHYTLGFPPYRTGGLTKYAFDLANAQAHMGENVIILWPGRYSKLKHAQNDVVIKHVGKLVSYELINPLPVSLMSGVKEYYNFTIWGNVKEFEKLLMIDCPDVIHVHTLMGLPGAFFEAAHIHKIPIVFTTHDYYGLCPKATLFYNGHQCSNIANCEICNQNALSMRKIKMYQSPLFRTIKMVVEKIHIKSIVKKIATNCILKKSKKYNNKEISDNNNYIILRSYYTQMFRYIDRFHFNSSVSEKTYRTMLDFPISGEVISIIHDDIEDHRIKRDFNKIRRLAFLGDGRKYKGFDLLIDVLDRLYENGEKFVLYVYGFTLYKREYLKIKGSYTTKQLDDIFNQTDIVVVPSIWNETFGFVALEAKSYAIPTIISSSVGAKDCFHNNLDGLVVDPDLDSLLIAIKRMLNEHGLLERINQAILDEDNSYLYSKHVVRIKDFYSKCISAKR